jgi:hypothetical protein
VTVDLTDDPLARQCLDLRTWIRAEFDKAKFVAAGWMPRPVPPNWGRNVRP